MSGNRPDRRIPERFRFWQGQALTSRDLTAITALAALMKAWHNRALHDAFGVAEGFDIEGDGRTVTVGPGTAYDVHGCPLVLDRNVSVDVPPLDGEARLLVARRPSRRGDRTCCGAADVAMPSEALEFGWVAAECYTPALGVALAKVEDDLSIRVSVRQPVRRERQPAIGFGATMPGQTDWRVWSDAPLSGIEVTIDTSAAGFTGTPCYFTSLQVTTPTGFGFLSPYWERIVNAGPIGFTLSLWLDLRRVSVGTTLGFSAIPSIARRELSVCWLGIQGHHRAAARPENDSEGGGHGCA